MTIENTFSITNICPVCSSFDLIPFIGIPDVPIFCNQLFPSYEQAIQTTKGNINLSFCQNCGHVFNTVFDPDLLSYSQAYENSLHFSPRFQEYAESLARTLIQKYDLNRKDVIEIGCGKGDFLNMLCELGDNTGIGFDPSYDEDRFSKNDNARFKVIQDLYSEKYSDQKADIICCRHVLEHINSPRDFLHSVRRTVGENLNTIVFFEVPNVMFTLKDLGIWDLIYEHCAYFSASSLRYIFQSTGFEVLFQEETFGSQFLCIEAKPTEGSNKKNQYSLDNLESISTCVDAFNKSYTNKVKEWQHDLEKMKQEGQKVVVWGGGSKGVTFLNTLKVKDHIDYIVDINPHKQGMYVAGTGQKIVAPEFLKGYRPDIIIIMNPVYTEEIQKIAQQHNVDCLFTPI